MDQAHFDVGAASGGIHVPPGRGGFIAALERRCRRCAEAMRRINEWEDACKVREWSVHILGCLTLLAGYEVLRLALR